jgi:hypothetical protein
VTLLGAGSGISKATAHRYRDQGIAVLAARPEDLHTALRRVAEDGWSQVILDGKLFDCDRPAETTLSVKAWFPESTATSARKVQGLMRPDGLPAWTSAAMLGHLHDISCARELDVTAALNGSAGELDLPASADSGYATAGHRIMSAVKRLADVNRSRPATAPTTGRCAVCAGKANEVSRPGRTLEDVAAHHRQPAPDR